MVVDQGSPDEVRDIMAPKLQRELLRHEGRWVVISNGALIGVGDSRDEVARIAAEQQIRQPLVYFVPRDGHRSMFF